MVPDSFISRLLYILTITVAVGTVWVVGWSGEVCSVANRGWLPAMKPTPTVDYVARAHKP